MKKVVDYADVSYDLSTRINKPLIKQILLQSDSLPKIDEVKDVKTAAVLAFKTQENEKHDSIKLAQEPRMQRNIEQLSEPGASSWLGALPLQAQGFNLTKGEFQDALAIRYNRPVKNMPSKCPCDKDFTVTHALNCKSGGFIGVRHDQIKNFECSLLKSLIKDVECEPPLHPVLNKAGYAKTANLEDGARCDIRARGFWRNGQNAFFDVAVTNADCDSQVDTSLKSVLRSHENKKKLKYNRRIMEVEHGTFTPLIFTVTGVMGHECSIFHKALAEKLSEKRNERYEDIVRYLRLKLSFLAVKSALLCLRGSRAVFKEPEVSDFSLALNELGVK